MNKLMNRLSQTIAFVSYCIAFCVFTYSNSLKAQSSINSPYSSYGVGEMDSKSYGNAPAMGGSSIAYQNDTIPMYFTNSGNPASYASNYLTTVDFGLNINRVQLQNSSAKQTINSGSIAYLALTFPIQKWWGSSVGLSPYSKVGYNARDSNNVTSATTEYVGSGGINQVYWGNAFRPFYRSPKMKAITFGANVSYLFGTIERVQNTEFPATSLTFNSRSSTSMRVGSFMADYGVQYGFSIDSVKGRKLNEPVKIMTGIIFGTNTNLKITTDTLAFSYLYNSTGVGEIKDTVRNKQGKGTVSIPLKYGIGLGFRKGDRWLVLADFIVQNWSDYKEQDKTKGLNNSATITLGGQYIPDNQGTYFKRINYRMGIKYSNTMLVFNNYQLTEQAVTFGFGLPVGYSRVLRNFSMINIGAELGSRGTTSNNLIKESFIRATIGFTINDKWFIRPKYD
jgi:hypothetical protein